MNIPEADELMQWLLEMGDESIIDDICETAMNRHNVRKARRPHIRAILDEAFGMALERAQDIKTELEKVDSITDEEIKKAVVADPDAAPIP